MSKKIKYNRYVLNKDIPEILKNKYPYLECPECHKNSVVSGCIEDQYDDRTDEYVILSFGIFCNECGAVLCKWDNTNREYFLGNR